VFIDDNKENIASAERLGIKGIVFTDTESLKQDLSSMGII
jgi:FMN phosphatase YigB (HAD superfamily)